MARSLSLKHPCFALALLYIASSCCEAQDAIQIVARAALCFDNRTVIDNCLTSMGISTNGTANATSNSSTTVPQQDNATASFCSSPCLGEMMLMTSCFDGIMSSFGFYRPGLMQGVQAIFQMACSGGGGNGSSNATLSRVAYGGDVIGEANIGDVLLVPAFMSLLMPLLFISFYLA
ncbi:uncharacterized protein LOC135633220 [Musa acuminata AAA Group]|uniref:uncharacterized protein LOC135633220 n=1 Tax=Musa acuminata AAA Group TaxID=214697 RepID=UPI0031D994ED